MNHYLRFVSPAVFAVGAILSATSCSSTKVGPLAANPKHEITYEVRIFEVPAGHDFISKASDHMTALEGEKLIRAINREPSFLATTGGRLGEKKTVTNKKEFVFPTEYAPANFNRTKNDGSFPVTPATPIAFEKTQVGTTVSFTGSGDSLTELSVALDRKVLLGFLNYGKPISAPATDRWGRKVEIVITENKIEKPVFSSNRFKTSLRLNDGDFMVLRNIDAKPVNNGRLPFTEKRPPSFIAVIRATRR
ncbi:MAG: hypothetical protein ACJAQT_003063 [Akkermansiaceae bacterium]|jgi:hypothetical protein